MQDKLTCIHANFAGRRRKFELRLGEMGELERICGAGIGAIYSRLLTEQWRYDDLRETIRLGLMGGGASEPDAHLYVENYVDKGPKRAHVFLAAQIVAAFIEGVDPPKDEGETAEKSDAPPETSPPSTKPAPPWDSPPETSTE